MKHSEMLNLNLPEDSDLINVSQISDNFERLDGMVDILPVQQETTTTDIDVTVYPPYWSMTNNTDSNITYVDHSFFDEEFVIEPGHTIRTNIDAPTKVSISSEVTIDYVYYIPAKDAFSGGGSGGTSDYNKLSNQPEINGVKLTGDKSAADLGLASASDLSDKISYGEKGASNGIATLDADGKVPQSQLPTPVAQKEYKLTETTSESYAKSYKLQVKDGETWSDVSESASINIPKDMVVESGSVKECTADNVPVSGYKKGDKYIDLVIANKTDAHIYINVKDLIDNKAEGIQYSNTTSKLTATNVQSAIDEIAETLKDKVDETELLSTISASSTTQIRDSKTVEFDGTGKNLEKLVLEGKTEQSGTPSPSNPIEVKGVGDGGWNIMPFAKKETKKVRNITVDSDGLGTYHIYGSNSSGTQNITFDIDSFVIPTAVGKSGKGCLYYNNTAANGLNSIYFLNGGVSVDYYSMSPVNRVISTYDDLGGKTVNQIRFAIGATGTIDFKVSLMVTNDGKTDHEFVPGGKYKIPISVGGTTKNVYLDSPLFDGEIADITSGIVNKKYGMYVLTGNETFTTTSIDSNLVQYAMDKPSDIAATSGYGQPVAICSIATRQTSATFTANIVGFGNKMGFVVNKSEFANDTAFKERLTTLYNAGTPAVVVYQLATPTKESFDGVEIPTVVGKNTLTVGTDVTPAKVEVTSFGEYYSKAEVDKMLADKQDEASVLGFKDVVYNHTGGGKNLINTHKQRVNANTTVTHDGETITVTGTGGTYARTVFEINTVPGREYIISMNVDDYTVIADAIRIRKSHIPSADSTAGDTTITRKGKLEIPMYATNDKEYVAVYVNMTSSALKNSITISDFMVRYKEIDDDTYVPYIPSNAELYQMIQELQS